MEKLDPVMIIDSLNDMANSNNNYPQIFPPSNNNNNNNNGNNLGLENYSLNAIQK
jgi:hypothetical protein